jgi:two-component system sensor histidine kinase PilS (NtrC family)
MTGSAEYAPAGILGAVIFVITGVVQLLRRRIVETEALAEQRGVDLQNLVELNEYIIQHLRESIVVVDSDDRIRLINESAGKLLGAEAAQGGAKVESISPELAGYLSRWRSNGTDFGQTTIVMGGADGEPNIPQKGNCFHEAVQSRAELLQLLDQSDARSIDPIHMRRLLIVSLIHPSTGSE